jgi:hypothetical protein
MSCLTGCGRLGMACGRAGREISEKVLWGGLEGKLLFGWFLFSCIAAVTIYTKTNFELIVQNHVAITLLLIS